MLSLLEKNPFPDQPPRFIRSVMYDYVFANQGDHANGYLLYGFGCSHHLFFYSQDIGGADQSGDCGGLLARWTILGRWFILCDPLCYLKATPVFLKI